MHPTPTRIRLADVTLIPLRAFNVKSGPGHTVAVLFRVAVEHIGHPHNGGDQARGDQESVGGVGAQE